MNKLMLVFIYCVISLLSCSTNSEQIKAAKKQLGYDSIALEKYKFKVIEIPAKDVYEMLAKFYQETANSSEQFLDIKNINVNLVSKYLKLANETGNRKCFKVHAFRPATENSVEHDVYIYLDYNNDYLISEVKQ